MRRRRIYLVLQSAVCCALAALPAASAISIYRDGQARRTLDPMASAYTPQLVAEKLAAIAPLFFAGVGLLVAGLVLGVGEERPRRAPVREKTPEAASSPKRPGAVQAALLAVAAALIVAGILNGSARDVLYKAITICTECVGLG